MTMYSPEVVAKISDQAVAKPDNPFPRLHLTFSESITAQFVHIFEPNGVKSGAPHT